MSNNYRKPIIIHWTKETAKGNKFGVYYILLSKTIELTLMKANKLMKYYVRLKFSAHVSSLTLLVSVWRLYFYISIHV